MDARRESKPASGGTDYTVYRKLSDYEPQEKKRYECSACGAPRGCNCDAPATERLAEKQEQDRQRARAYRERKDEQEQQPRHVTAEGLIILRSVNHASRGVSQMLHGLEKKGLDRRLVLVTAIERLKEALRIHDAPIKSETPSALLLAGGF